MSKTRRMDIRKGRKSTEMSMLIFWRFSMHTTQLLKNIYMYLLERFYLVPELLMPCSWTNLKLYFCGIVTVKEWRDFLDSGHAFYFKIINLTVIFIYDSIRLTPASWFTCTHFQEMNWDLIFLRNFIRCFVQFLGLNHNNIHFLLRISVSCIVF